MLCFVLALGYFLPPFLMTGRDLILMFYLFHLVVKRLDNFIHRQFILLLFFLLKVEHNGLAFATEDSFFFFQKKNLVLGLNRPCRMQLLAWSLESISLIQIWARTIRWLISW